MSFRPWTELAREAAKAMPPGKRPAQCKSTFFICLNVLKSDDFEWESETFYIRNRNKY